jgi:uncharacterized protein involved in exopolysaccharide biosynthesis/Mrp family chromosome partitioning ATPase
MRRSGQQEFREWYSSPVPNASASSNVGDFIRVLRRRKTLVALVVATILLVTFLAIARMTPIYSTTAVVMIEPLDAPLGTTAAPAVASPNEEGRIATKLELLASRALARRVAKSLNLDETKEFAPETAAPGLLSRVLSWFTPDRPSAAEGMLRLDREDRDMAERARMEKVTDQLVDHLQIERLAKSHLISITASSTDPFMAALIANRLADTHIKSQLTADRDANEQRAEQLRARVDELRNQLQNADREVASYRRAHGLFVAKPEEFTQAQITRLAGSLAEAQADAAASSTRARNVQGSAGDPASAIVSSPLLNDLRGQETTLRKRLSELTAFYGRGYPEVTSTTAQLSELQSRIAVEVARAAGGLRNEASAGAARAGRLASDVGGLQAQSYRNGFDDVGLRDLERTAQTSNALYLSLLARLKEIDAKGNSEHSDTSIVSRAPVPDDPSYPQPKRALGVALLGSIMLAVIAAFAAEALDTRLRTAGQVRRVLGLPTLAMIPQFSAAMRDRTARDIVREQPRSFFVEALRNLVIELETRRTNAGSQVIVVTSPLPDEGKTTVAKGLAAAAAAIGRSTVVVDLDMRKRGRSHENFTTDNDVVAFLTDKAALDDVLSPPSDPASYAAISVTQFATDPGGLLESPRLRQLFAELRERFDLIVVNAPPILPVHDAKSLARLADGALLVLRWGRTTPEVARIAVEMFGEGIIGAVVNRVDYRKHARRGYGDAIEHSARLGGEYQRQGDDAIETTPLLGRWRAAAE